MKTTAYPIEELGGLLFAYLGAEPRPLLPRYNVLVWGDAVREIQSTIVPCNWLQVMENLLDPMHVECLHGRYFASVQERKGQRELQEFMALHCPPPMKKIGFDLFDHGIIERHVVQSEQDPSWTTGTASFFPTTSLLGSPRGGSVIFIVPLDDTHTRFLLDMGNRTGQPVMQPSIPLIDVPGVDASGAFALGTANGQDHMAVVTQGNIARREAERLGSSDLGILLYRELLAEQMALCESGRDPMNTRRNPSANVTIETPESWSPEEAGWSRQRRRWAERHRDSTLKHEMQAKARGSAGSAVLIKPKAEPVSVREHREVVIR